jgi:RNA polymerase sigma factor (TIGR02999 family)
MVDAQPDLTRLLNRMFQGDRAAGDAAMQALYTQLNRIARGRMRREAPGHILDTGALVNEAMLRLFGTSLLTVQNRQHFLALACLLMKRVLIDHGRRKSFEFTAIEDSMAVMDTPDRERMIAFDRMFQELAVLDPAGLQAIQLKVGAGMTSDEIAHQMAISVPTVNRALKRARIWLLKELGPFVNDIRN